jgi:DNA polymerase III subunit alpha
MFGEGNFYLELQDHGIPSSGRQRGLRRLSRKLGVPWWRPTTATTCARTTPWRTTCCCASARRRWLRRPGPAALREDEFYLKSAPTRCTSSSRRRRRRSRTRCAIAERCDLEIPHRRTFHLPEFPVPAGTPSRGTSSRWRARGWTSARGAAGARLAASCSNAPEEIYRERLAHEIAVIGRWVSRAISWSSGTSSATPARTAFRSAPAAARPPARWSRTPAHHRHRPAAVRPALRALPQSRAHQHAGHRHRLLHAAPRRGDPVRGEKYGEESVAQIITFNTLARPSRRIRDVGRVMGMPYGGRPIAKLIPDDDQVARARPRKVAAAARAGEGDDPRSASSSRRRAGSRAWRATRGARRRRRHRAAPLVDLVPLYKTSHGEIVTQWDKDDVIESSACSRWTSWACAP